MAFAHPGAWPRREDVGHQAGRVGGPGAGLRGRVQPVRAGRGARRRGPAVVRVPDVRTGAADQVRGDPGRASAAHRRTVGPVQRRRGEQPARLEPAGADRRGDRQARADEPDDQHAVHQAAELQQHGRPGCDADPDVGGEGDRPADPDGPLGLSVCGHRCARHLRADPPCRVSTGLRRSGSPASGPSSWPARTWTTSR